jgi:uncharacterized protein (TIGR00304 family)
VIELQNLDFLLLIGISLILIGVLFVLMSVFASSEDRESSVERQESKSRGIILLGPIPIVWGFGENSKRMMLILFLFAFVISILILF